jgi:hypothetical protein
MRGAGRVLNPGGLLVTYGPYRVEGTETAPSNEAFDSSLQSRNPEWGLRNLGDVRKVASLNGLEFVETVSMPANNLCVVFQLQRETK